MSNPNIDLNIRTPLDLVWDQILASGDESLALQYRRIFARFLDADENLEHRKFTILHKIIFGLSSIPLTAQLQLSTADINTPCVHGRTPLYWAVRKGDLDAVSILIKYGADISIAATTGHTPLHIATAHSIASLKILLNAAAAINNSMNHTSGPESPESISSTEFKSGFMESILERKVSDGSTPLAYAALFDHTGEGAALLLSYSANINASPPPLNLAIEVNNHAVLTLLLSRGASLNGKDRENQGVLHLSAIIGDLKTLKILAAANVKVEGFEDKDIYGHTPLQAFDIVRPTMVSETAEMRAQCKEVFLGILNRQGPKRLTELEVPEAMPAGEESEEELDVFYDFDDANGKF